MKASELKPEVKETLLKAKRLIDIQKNSIFGNNEWEACSKLLKPIFKKLAEYQAPNYECVEWAK